VHFEEKSTSFLYDFKHINIC